MSVKHSLELNASNQLTRWHCFVFCLFVCLFVGQVSDLNPKICNSPKGWSVLFLSFQSQRKTNNFKTTNSNLHQPIKTSQRGLVCLSFYSLIGENSGFIFFKLVVKFSEQDISCQSKELRNTNIFKKLIASLTNLVSKCTDELDISLFDFWRIMANTTKILEPCLES